MFVTVKLKAKFVFLITRMSYFLSAVTKVMCNSIEGFVIKILYELANGLVTVLNRMYAERLL